MGRITDDSGEIMVPGKLGKSPPPLKPAGKHRKFPFRLWAWAIVMTGLAGAGGYYTYKFHNDKDSAVDAKNSAMSEKDKLKADADLCKKNLDTASTDLAALGGKHKESESALAQKMSSLGDCETALSAARAGKAETDKRMAAVADFQKKFSDMVGTGKLKVAGHRGNLILELPSEVLFPSGSAELSKSGELNVLQVGLILKEMPDRRFLVVGHTDAAPLNGSIYKDNWELSTARSLTVVRFLVQAGMKAQNLIPAGEGEHDPVADNSSTAGRARNRRIEIILMPAISELPPLPAGLEDAGGAKKPK
jgi:chemotaxis protein MotB